MKCFCSLGVSWCPIGLSCSWYFCQVATEMALYVWKDIYITGHVWNNMNFNVCFYWHIWNFDLWIISPLWVQDRDWVLCNYCLQCYSFFCIVEDINPRRRYQDMQDLDLPWVPIDITIDSNKGRNGDNLFYFPRGETVFWW